MEARKESLSRLVFPPCVTSEFCPGSFWKMPRTQEKRLRAVPRSATWARPPFPSGALPPASPVCVDPTGPCERPPVCSRVAGYRPAGRRKVTSRRREGLRQERSSRGRGPAGSTRARPPPEKRAFVPLMRSLGAGPLAFPPRSLLWAPHRSTPNRSWFLQSCRDLSGAGVGPGASRACPSPAAPLGSAPGRARGCIALGFLLWFLWPCPPWVCAPCRCSRWQCWHSAGAAWALGLTASPSFPASEAGGIWEAEDRRGAEGPVHSQPHQARQVRGTAARRGASSTARHPAPHTSCAASCPPPWLCVAPRGLLPSFSARALGSHVRRRCRGREAELPVAGTGLGWEAARGPGQQAGQTEWLPDDRAGDRVALAELAWPPSFSPPCTPAECAAWGCGCGHGRYMGPAPRGSLCSEGWSFGQKRPDAPWAMGAAGQGGPPGG